MMSFRRTVPWVLLCAAATALATGCGGQQAPPQTPPPAQVSVVTLAPRTVELTTELPGRTTAHRIAEIRPQVNGIIKERPFAEGADVHAGELLYRIDPAPYEAALAQAKAALAQAEAGLPALRSRAERLAKLAEIDAVTQQDVDDANAALRQAEANIQAGHAAVDAARINLGYTPITAPISGRIGRSSVTVGALVTAYQPQALATIQQLDPIYVDVTQASADVLRLRRSLASGRLSGAGANQRRAKLLLEDGTPYSHEGTLEFRDVTVDPSTGSVTLRLVFPNPDHVLLPGMFVRAVVAEGVDDQALLVPQQGVTRDPKGAPIAWVVNDEGTVEQRSLTLDRTIGDAWLATAGLAAGDRVIVEGRQKVRPGAKVEAVPFAPAGETADPAEAGTANAG